MPLSAAGAPEMRGLALPVTPTRGHGHSPLEGRVINRIQLDRPGVYLEVEQDRTRAAGIVRAVCESDNSRDSHDVAVLVGRDGFVLRRAARTSGCPPRSDRGTRAAPDNPTVTGGVTMPPVSRR